MRIATRGGRGQVFVRRRLFVDVAVISRHDAGTGIQRVVRALALALLDEVAGDWDIRFVSATRKTGYHHIVWPPTSESVQPEQMRGRQGDVFLGLDYSLDAVRRHRWQLAEFRREGGAVWFLVHDLLPLHHPEWFSRNTVTRYKAWLSILAGLGDGYFCNSYNTEAELKSALANIYDLKEGFCTQVLPMGHAVFERKEDPTEKVFELVGGVAPFDTSAPFALMVGTLEPRKGHSDVIAAFETLWQRGGDERLVLVGRLGWKVEALHRLVQDHCEYGSRLLWLDRVDDQQLSEIYEACTGVIVASHGEGFGLPLIEALGHGKPVLARDLPVFRSHEHYGVRFFPTNARPLELADAIERWLDQVNKGAVAVSRPTSDWRQSALTLLAAIDRIPPAALPK